MHAAQTRREKNLGRLPTRGLIGAVSGHATAANLPFALLARYIEGFPCSNVTKVLVWPKGYGHSVSQMSCFAVTGAGGDPSLDFV